MRLISADSHMDYNWLPEDLFISQASIKNRDRMPYVDGSSGRKMWRTGEGRNLGQVGQYEGLMESPRWQQLAATGLFSDGQKGLYRPGVSTERLKDLDLDGVEAEAIYGIIAIGVQFQDEDLLVEVAEIYNNWMSDFMKAAPNRLVGIANIPMANVKVAVNEVQRASRLGYIAGHILPSQYIHPLYDSYWMPLWEEFAKADMALCFHPIFNPRIFNVKLSDPTNLALAEMRIANLFSVFQMGVAPFLSALIFSGVFDKIPTLQVVVAESGLGWLPYFFERMEIVAKSHSNKIGLKRSPCDYFGTNFHVCYQSEPLGVESFVKTYPNNVMFASDYPHPDGVWPFSRQCAKTELANLSIDNREKVLWRNASRVFKIT